MVIAAEAAGAGAALAAGLIESPRSLRISMERRVPAAGTIINTTIFAGVAAHTAAHVVSDTAFTAAAIVIVAVVKSIAARVVAVIVKNYVAAAPAYTPVAPAPSEPAVEADAEAHSPKTERGRRTRFRDTDTSQARPLRDSRTRATDHRREHRPHRETRVEWRWRRPAPERAVAVGPSNCRLA